LAAGIAIGLAPAGLAAAWVPIRDDLPNTDAALILVVGVAAVAYVGGKAATVVGALTAVTGFDFFDTPPYGQLLMTRSRDVVTALVLLLASLLVGSLAVSLRSYRTASARRTADFNVMASAARLVSVGEAAGVVVNALAGELIARLDLRDCEFVYGPPEPGRPVITRDGTLDQPAGPETTELALPVWGTDSIRGHYRLILKSPGPPRPERLLAAVGIGEQAGAALTMQLVDPEPARRPGGPEPAPRPKKLRLVR
jgi:hypothetical protein